MLLVDGQPDANRQTEEGIEQASSVFYCHSKQRRCDSKHIEYRRTYLGGATQSAATCLITPADSASESPNRIGTSKG